EVGGGVGEGGVGEVRLPGRAVAEELGGDAGPVPEVVVDRGFRHAGTLGDPLEGELVRPGVADEGACRVEGLGTVLGPGEPSSRRELACVDHLDLLPTVGNLLGVTYHE